MIKSQSIMGFMRLITNVLLGICLSACSAIHNARNINNDNYHYNDYNHFLLKKNQHIFEQIVRHVDIKSRILKQYNNWKGVRYRLGGVTKQGIDCSAFVQRTFREQFGLKLPRSTSGQQSTGRGISRNKLLPGDLILFRSVHGRHIGIYLGNNNFVHASSSKGVRISNLNNHYWKLHYHTARRVLVKT